MSNPAFDLFEEICGELSDQGESVLIDDDFSPVTLQGLKRWSQETATTSAVAKALDFLQKHFEARGSTLPFKYDLATGRVTVLSREYADFVAEAQNQRSKEKESRNFEVASAKCLQGRLTGIIRRVGWPRTTHRKPRELSAYLHKHFGFRAGVLIGNDRDGGLDILWFPPLGSTQFPAIVSVQCKNSLYDRGGWSGVSWPGRTDSASAFLRFSSGNAFALRDLQ
jgi:hypothetical protein